jgi:hypothetical protein
MRSNITLGFAIVWSVASGAPAAPLELKQVAADAKWLAHVDIDAVRASTVVQKAWTAGLQKYQDADNKLSFVQAMLNMDLTKDVRGITLYGREIGQPKAVTIVAANFDPDRILGLTRAIPGRETTKSGDYEIHSWHGKHRDHEWAIAAVFRKQDQLLLANSVDDIKAALEVLDGKSAGLTTDAPLAGNVPAGTTFLLRVRDIARANLHCKAPISHEIDSFRLVTGENDGQSFVRARLTMTSADVAGAALQAVQGWKAAASLFMSDELGRKFAAAVSPKAHGNSVTVLWSASADDVWEGVQKIEKAVTRHMAEPKGAAGKHGCPWCQSGAGSGNCPLCDGKSGGDEKKAVPKEEDF